MQNGLTALLVACHSGSCDVVEVLIAAGADVNVKDDEYGGTGLHFAANSCHTDIACVLIDANPDNINATNKVGNTPLHVAARRAPDVAEVRIRV